MPIMTNDATPSTDTSRSTAPVALTIAGSDPSGGAGLQVDLKTFHALRCYGTAVVSLLTVQNTRSVERVELVDAELVVEQIRHLVGDVPPAAVKTGALGSAELIGAVAAELAEIDAPIAVDPVMISKHGDPLLPEDAVGALRDRLLPMAHVVTPNRLEAAALSGVEIANEADARRAAERLLEFGARAVVVKGVPGGDTLEESGGRRARDLLLTRDAAPRILDAERVETRNLHGSGCVFAAAITARLAHGDEPGDAAVYAKRFVSRAIRDAPELGGGYGPLNLFAKIGEKSAD